MIPGTPNPYGQPYAAPGYQFPGSPGAVPGGQPWSWSPPPYFEMGQSIAGSLSAVPGRLISLGGILASLGIGGITGAIGKAMFGTVGGLVGGLAVPWLLTYPFTHIGQAMTTGAMQQAALVSAMRSDWRFLERGTIERGFTIEELRSFSDFIRDLSKVPELMTNFEELVRVSRRMKQYGLLLGVTSGDQLVREFKETFDTINAIAKAAGTTLEEATRHVARLRQLGFTGKELSAFVQTRAAAGILGIQEGVVAQAQQAGAAMAYQFGGEISAGATGVTRLMGMISQAVQSGQLTQQQLTQATGGLTGGQAVAETARRLYQATLTFLQTDPGRLSVAAFGRVDQTGRYTGQIDLVLLSSFLSGQINYDEVERIARQKLSSPVAVLTFRRLYGRIAASLSQFAGPELLRNIIKERMPTREEALYMLQQYTGSPELAEFLYSAGLNYQEMMGQWNQRQFEMLNVMAARAQLAYASLPGLWRRFKRELSGVLVEPFEEAGANIYNRISSWAQRTMERVAGVAQAPVTTAAVEELRRRELEAALLGRLAPGERLVGGWAEASPAALQQAGLYSTGRVFGRAAALGVAGLLGGTMLLATAPVSIPATLLGGAALVGGATAATWNWLDVSRWLEEEEGRAQVLRAEKMLAGLTPEQRRRLEAYAKVYGRGETLQEKIAYVLRTRMITQEQTQAKPIGGEADFAMVGGPTRLGDLGRFLGLTKEQARRMAENAQAVAVRMTQEKVFISYKEAQNTVDKIRDALEKLGLSPDIARSLDTKTMGVIYQILDAKAEADRLTGAEDEESRQKRLALLEEIESLKEMLPQNVSDAIEKILTEGRAYEAKQEFDKLNLSSQNLELISQVQERHRRVTAIASALKDSKLKISDVRKIKERLNRAVSSELEFRRAVFEEASKLDEETRQKMLQAAQLTEFLPSYERLKQRFQGMTGQQVLEFLRERGALTSGIEQMLSGRMFRVVGEETAEKLAAAFAGPTKQGGMRTLADVTDELIKKWAELGPKMDEVMKNATKFVEATTHAISELKD